MPPVPCLGRRGLPTFHAVNLRPAPHSPHRRAWPGCSRAWLSGHAPAAAQPAAQTVTQALDLAREAAAALAPPDARVQARPARWTRG